MTCPPDLSSPRPLVTPSRHRLVIAYGALPAHEALRAEAARFHEVAPSSIVMGHECPRCGSEAHGRPRLLATATVRRPAYVSLARAGDLSVVAITDAGPVGVDVEAEGAADFVRFEDVALHPDEYGTTAVDSTRTWVRKESLLKAHGLGLAVDPRDVLLDDHGLSTWDSRHPPPTGVWLRDFTVPGHVGAVVVIVLDELDVARLSPVVRPATT